MLGKIALRVAHLFLKNSYTPPTSELPGTQTFVTPNSKKDLSNKTDEKSEHNYKTRPSAPENSETVRPLPPSHKKERVRYLNSPSYNTPSDSSDDSTVSVRTPGTPGEEYGHPYKDNVYPRRTSKKRKQKGLLPYGKNRQREQKGRAKLYSKLYYLRNRSKKKRDSKIWYKLNKRKWRTKKKRQLYNDKGWKPKFKRRPGGVSSQAERSKKWRNENKKSAERVADLYLEATFYREQVPPESLSQTWRGRKDQKQISELPEGTTSWVAPMARRPGYQDKKEQDRPGHLLDTGQVTDNPGSARVIPSGKGFVNKEAATIAEIEKWTQRLVHNRSQNIPVDLVRADRKNGVWKFKAGDYDVYVKGDMSNKRATRMSTLDVKISCTCGFWKFQGPEYHAKVGDYLYRRPQGMATKPVVRDPRGENKCCKHVLAVLRLARNYKVRR